MVKQSLTRKKFLLPHIPINLDNRRGISMRLWRVLYFDLWFLLESTFSVVLQKLSPISQSTFGGPILYFIHCYKHFTTLLLRSKLPKQILRWLHVSRGGSRGRVQGVGTPPEMTCGVEVEQETSAPPYKKNPGSAPGKYTQSSYQLIIDLSRWKKKPEKIQAWPRIEPFPLRWTDVMFNLVEWVKPVGGDGQ